MKGLAALLFCSCVAAAMLAPSLPAAAAGLDVKTVKINTKTDQEEIEVAYPKTGIAEIDKAFADWATGMVGDFEKTVKEDFSTAESGGPPFGPYSLYLSFDVPRNDDKLLVFDFAEEIFTGGAHPGHDIITYNFMMPDGWQVFLPEIFKRQALAKISNLAIADLNKQLLGPDAMSDANWIKTGAGPMWGNFTDFLLLPDTLVIHFPQYQVAAYASGPQEVKIPLAALSGLMRDDWRTPVPSFDCAKASTATEKAICSDVDLARLDRSLADAYAQAIAPTGDGGGVGRIKDEQRAWVAKRDACGGDVGCLTSSYQARLKALQAG